jgi:hypothetical protein
MNLKVLERDGTNHTPAIVAALNVHFQTIKRRDPRGFLDQFESRLSLLCTEVAQELGGLFDEEGDALVFRFV